MRVVNVVDLMTLFPPDVHPHGMDETRSSSSSPPTSRSSSPSMATSARSTRSCMGGRNAERFHVRGFNEQGTTTTPFDMVVLNGMSRYHLAIEALAPLAADARSRARPDRRLRNADRARQSRTLSSTWRTCPRSATGCGA